MIGITTNYYEENFIMKTFLCFSSSCRNDIVEPLYNILTNAGLNIWYDYRCMLFGDGYVEKNFIEGISMSKYAIIIFNQDIFTRQCAVEELNYIKELNEAGRISIFPIFFNTNINNMPPKYQNWIRKYIYNSYDTITVSKIKTSALQIAPKLYSEIIKDTKTPSLRIQVSNINDVYEKQIMDFCESVENGSHLIKATALFLLYKYHSSKSNINVTVENNLRYLLRQIIDCNPVLITSILYCMESLVRLNY